ncbi:hypothetical protein Cylst_0608 [Cylindrospermum stagnale PCC 7417]|uniref:Uncharacterized protein n=1 Tax=Cylindrospermum stagnale PCC 7417 TaxID=56107 RepID=K9WT34_9NOST|nr:hypothetical protein [Cylindrospermum stagnale]AFZ22941.1 hypothetical protein Cylst_0608 [Cylindrospermum stagnale PCC 7417]
MRQANRRQHDLYLLLDVDVPRVDDSQRYLPNYREEFGDRSIQQLGGTLAACLAVDQALAT